jgi:flagellar protein FlaI
MLNTLCSFIQAYHRVVTIEDTRELNLPHENWIPAVSRTGFGVPDSTGYRYGEVTLFELLKESFRQNPDYVIVGEVRGNEAFTLFQAISVGHSSMSTVHAGNIDELLHRVENEPMNIPRVLFQSLDVVAFQSLVSVGNRRVRRVMGVTEVLGVENVTKNLLTNNAFAWSPKDDAFLFSGRSFVLEEIAKEKGMGVDALMNEVKARENYLRAMDERGITYYKAVSRAISNYYVDSVKAREEIGAS